MAVIINKVIIMIENNFLKKIRIFFSYNNLSLEMKQFSKFVTLLCQIYKFILLLIFLDF